ncbi:MAG: anthranilate synthase component I family protein [Phycisphaerales bacterium]
MPVRTLKTPVRMRSPAAADSARLMASWDPRRPLAALWSAGAGGERSRWSVLAEPAGTYRFEMGAGGAGRSRWIGSDPPPADFTHDPLADLGAVTGAVTGATRRDARGGDGAAPFQEGRGGWIGSISYELGRVLEPAASGPRRPGDDRGLPLIEFHRCPAERTIIIDQATGTVSAPDTGEFDPFVRGAPPGGFTLGALRSATGREGYMAAVARGVEYIRAGDVFQVNLAHRLSARFEGSTRALFLRLAGSALPWYGAYLESADGGARRAVLSMSPELFVEFDPRSRAITTRPMKGTRPGGADPRELAASLKDRAELAMIIDLMRNDLGRVCSFRSVRVPDARTIESHGVAAIPAEERRATRGATHPSVWQAVGTVTGVLREGLGVRDVLGACFPPGSVTGAPKIRAMQIIDELEPVARGAYCGCVGWIGDDGHFAFNVAIRTAIVTGKSGSAALDDIRGGVLDYSVGAGIVADSNPDAEWRETLDKAAVFEGLM